jgi:hypothetical protein
MQWDGVVKKMFRKKEEILPMQLREVEALKVDLEQFFLSIREFRTQFRSNAPFTFAGTTRDAYQIMDAQVYMCICIFMYIYILYMYIYIYTCISIFCIYVCIHILCMYIYINIYLYVYRLFNLKLKKRKQEGIMNLKNYLNCKYLNTLKLAIQEVN